MAGGSGSTEGARQRRWFWAARFVAVYIVVPRVLVWVLDGLVALGGHGLSNAVVGLIASAGCFFAVQRRRVRQLRMQAEGDPEPLPETYDDATRAQMSYWGGWSVGIAMWAATAAWIVLVGSGSLLVLGPVLGTTAIVLGRMERDHARAMDTRRGRPTAGH